MDLRQHIAEHCFPAPDIRTERLHLRGLTRADLPALYGMRSDPRMVDHTDQTVDASISDTEAYLDRMLAGHAGGKWIVWGIESIADGRLLGSASLWNFNAEGTCAEFGYGLIPDAWGRGYMQEALSALLGFAFVDLALEAVEAYTESGHERSIRLLTKLGFQRTGSIDEPGSAVPRVFAMDVFRASAAAWKKARGGMKGGTYKNGQIVSRLKDGVFTYFFQTGIVKASGPLKDGVMDGEWIFNRDDGRLWQTGGFREGQKDGAWIRYDREGNVEYDETFVLGKIVKKR